MVVLLLPSCPTPVAISCRATRTEGPRRSDTRNTVAPGNTTARSSGFGLLPSRKTGNREASGAVERNEGSADAPVVLTTFSGLLHRAALKRALGRVGAGFATLRPFVDMEVLKDAVFEPFEIAGAFAAVL
jgi:hypothetical protein